MACKAHGASLHGWRCWQWMSEHRIRRKRASKAGDAPYGSIGWALALWGVAAFLGAFLGSHYVLSRILGTSESEVAIWLFV